MAHAGRGIRGRTSNFGIALASAVALLLVTACGSAGLPKVAAVVDGVPVPSEIVERLAKQYQDSPPPTDTSTGAPLAPLDLKEVRQLVLQYSIRLSYLEKVARDRKIIAKPNPVLEKILSVTSAADFSGSGWTASDLENGDFAGSISEQLALQLFPTIAISETEVKQKYNANKDTFKASWTADVRAAFFGIQEAANEVRTQVLGGAPFDETATKLGGTQVGSMGSITSGASLPQPILDAIGSLQPKQPSEPVAASGGWIVFFVDSRVDTPAQSYDAVSAQLRTVLTDQRRQQLFSGWFDKHLKEAPVKVDHFYGKWSVSLGTVV